MKAMQSLVKIPEIQATMRELSKEMMKVTEPCCPFRVPFGKWQGLGWAGVSGEAAAVLQMALRTEGQLLTLLKPHEL